MYFRTIATLSILAATAVARQCTNLTVPISISARQATFDIAVSTTSIEVIDFALNITQQGRNFTAIAQTGFHTTTGDYNISAMFCQPDKQPENPTV